MCKSRSVYGKMAFVPFADLVNHEYDGNLEWKFDKESGFSYRAKRDIEKGQIVNTAYAYFDQYQAFMNYGFLPDPPSGSPPQALNPFDSINFIITIPEKVFTTGPYAKQKDGVIQPKYRQQSFTMKSSLADRNFMNMLMFARFIVFDEPKDDAVIKSINIAYLEYKKAVTSDGG